MVPVAQERNIKTLVGSGGGNNMFKFKRSKACYFVNFIPSHGHFWRILKFFRNKKNVESFSCVEDMMSSWGHGVVTSYRMLTIFGERYRKNVWKKDGTECSRECLWLRQRGLLTLCKQKRQLMARFMLQSYSVLVCSFTGTDSAHLYGRGYR